MKTILIALGVFLGTTIYYYGQTGNNQIGVGAEGDFLMGSYSSAYNVGFGGNLKGLFGVGQSGQISLTAGYSSFSSKSGTIFAGQTLSLVPILAGYRYNTSNGFYGEPQIGVGILTTKVPGASYSQTNFAGSLNVGYVTNGFDVSLRYYTEGDVISMFAIRLGYNFSLKGK
jgi:hypothetical protein